MFSMLCSVAAGGALGAASRYLIGVAVTQRWPHASWVATLSVNMAGCFVMGLLAGYISLHTSLSEAMRGFVAIGFLGAFTTFSSFTLDVHLLFEKGSAFAAAGYVAITMISAISAFFIGLGFIRAVSGSG